MASIDLDAVLAKLHSDLVMHKEKIKETEIKIQYVQELAQMAGVVTSTRAIPKNGKRSLSDSIVGLLEERGQWLSTGEIAEELSKQGLEEKSTSGNFKMLVITTVPKLWKRKIPKIARIEGQGGIKYGMLSLNPKEGSSLENKN